MKKLLGLLSCVIFLTAAAAPRPDAEAAAMLKKMAEQGKKFTPVSGRTAFFSRAQLKYGLERDDYLHRWVDRPLFQDTSLQKFNDGTMINPETWKVMHRVRNMYQMDGFAFFPQTGRWQLFTSAATPGYTVSILPELVFIGKENKGKIPDSIFETIDAALKSKEAYRINGKLLLTSYPGATDPQPWATLKKVLNEKYGDKFIIAPMHQMPVRLVGITKKTITAAELTELRDIIREWLRHVDGYYYNYPPLNEWRRYDAAFDREVMIPLLHSILSEDEFKGKVLAWGTKVGHENFYRTGSFTYNCEGTAMLRGSVGSAVAARADAVNLVEWDEQNENTSFRPTLCNSFSTQRIIRAFSGMAKGKFFPRLPEDDGSVPNLTLSYRRIITAGETLELEVVNIPEAESSGKIRKIELTLKDISGKIVRNFKGELSDLKLAELRFSVKVADVLDHHVLIPELSVDGRKFSTGFTPIELRANWNGDNKWVSQPLRDIAPCRAELKIAGRLPDGRIKLKGKIISDKPLHSVAVLDGGDPVYMHGTDPDAVASDKREVFTIYIGGYGKRNLRYKGTIKVTGAPSVRYFNQQAHGGVVPPPTAEGWKLPGIFAQRSFSNDQLLAVSVERSELDKAMLEFDLDAFIPGKEQIVFCRKKFSLAELARKRIWAETGLIGTRVILRRTDIGQRLLEGLNVKSAEFTILADPALPQSVFCIEAVASDRKTFRSLPVTVYRPTGKKAEFSAFDFLGKKRVVVRCDSGLLTPLLPEISPEYGAAVSNSGGHELTGMLGHSCGWLSNLRFMESLCCGNLADDYFRTQLPHNISSAPEIVKDADGKWCWKFSGSQNVAFPICSIYPYSGFEMRITFTPDDDLKQQRSLVSSGHAGFNLEIQNGLLRASLFRGNHLAGRSVVSTTLPLVPGEKCEAVVRFDQKKLQILCNGKASRAVRCSGYQLYPAELSIGHDKARGKKFKPSGHGFSGLISKFELRPL